MDESQQDQQHSQKPTLRRLSEFCTEDPTVYSAWEIKEMLDMINDGGHLNPNNIHDPYYSLSKKSGTSAQSRRRGGSNKNGSGGF